MRIASQGAFAIFLAIFPVARELIDERQVQVGQDVCQVRAVARALGGHEHVQLAVADVSNSLVGYSQSQKYRAKIQEQTNTYFETARLANVRFTGGATSFLEVLVTQQQYFDSELALAQAWNVELQNYVQLYRALGGGWEM